MDVKIVKTQTDDIDGTFLFDSIECYLNKNNYPKNLVIKKFKLQNEKFRKTITELKKTIKKADDTVTTFNNTIEKIKRSNERRVEVLMKSNV
jgi:hypothetical protein